MRLTEVTNNPPGRAAQACSLWENATTACVTLSDAATKLLGHATAEAAATACHTVSMLTQHATITV